MKQVRVECTKETLQQALKELEEVFGKFTEQFEKTMESSKEVERMITREVPMYLCKSYYDGETDSIKDCTCGKCVKK